MAAVSLFWNTYTVTRRDVMWKRSIIHSGFLAHLSSPLKSIFENPWSAVNCIHEALVSDSICVLKAWLRLQSHSYENEFFSNAIKTESTRTLSNFDFQWTKILYEHNLKHIAFCLTLFKG